MTPWQVPQDLPLENWWVAEVDDRVVGVASLGSEMDDSRVADVNIVAVEDATWEQGVGLELVRGLLDRSQYRRDGSMAEGPG